jgi:hypothetical protein
MHEYYQKEPSTPLGIGNAMVGCLNENEVPMAAPALCNTNRFEALLLRASIIRQCVTSWQSCPIAAWQTKRRGMRQGTAPAFQATAIGHRSVAKQARCCEHDAAIL